MARATQNMLKRDQIYLSATQKDAEAALRLMEGLEHFDIPSSLEVTPGMEDIAKRRQVMRHGQENPRSADLPELVTQKLAESAVMVLVCSSSSATSRWIRAEVEEFYRTHPRGPIIPVVLDGEPNPAQSRQAFEKPCFPDNLKRADLERWVDARATNWAETAPVAALASMLGLRVEQMVFHEAYHARRMREQRGQAFAMLATCFVLMLFWVFRWPLHETLRDQLGVYRENVAPGLESWLHSADEVVRVRHASEPLVAAVPKPSVESTATSQETPRSEAPPAENSELAEADPVAVQLALNAWLDEAERYLPNKLNEAERWISKARESLRDRDSIDFGNELYRVHALSAVIAKRRRDSDLSRAELIEAVKHWTAIPIQDLASREQEGFDILATIAPTEEWRDSAVQLTNWLGSLPGNEVRISQRAGRLIELVRIHPFLAKPVQEWMENAAAQMNPPAQDSVATAAKFSMLRADFIRNQGNKVDAVAVLDAGEKQLEGVADPESALHQALLAQLKHRQSELSGSAVPLKEMKNRLEAIQAGYGLADWESWFGEDLRSSWIHYGDLKLSDDSFRDAIDAYNRALEFSESPEQLAGILLKSGCAYRYDGDAAGAWDAFSLAVPIFEEAKDDRSLLTALLGSVLAARDLNRPKEGRNLQERASQLQARLGTAYQPPAFWREPIAPVEFTENVEAEPTVQSTPPVLKPVAASPGAGTTPAQPRPEPETVPESPQELEARIVTVQRKIAELEADSQNRRTFQGLDELQDLYAELDSLLRKKLTGNSGS